MTQQKEKGRVGSSFESFLKDQGVYEKTTEQAVKRVLAYQLAAAMKKNRLNKVEMAKQLRTSRAQLDRLLDPDNSSVTLATLAKAAQAVGRTLHIELR